MRLRLFLPGVLVVLGALAQSSRYLVSRLDIEMITGVSRAAGRSLGMADLTKPGLTDWISLGIWRLGGSACLGWMRWFGIFCAWAIGLTMAVALLTGVFALIRGAAARRMFVAVCAAGWLWITLSGIYTGMKWHREALGDPVFTSPLSLLESLRASASGRVYCNFKALPYLLAYCPKLVDGNLSPSRLGALGLDPAAWRQEDRKKPFGAVLLVEPGDDTDPLLRHLLISPDWHLAALNNLGIVFLPGGGSSYQPPSPESAAPPLGDDRLKAIYLAEMAHQLYAVGLTGSAHAYIAEARRLAADDPSVLMRAAALFAMEKKWNDALDAANAALVRQPDLVEAKIILARAYLAVGSPAQAYQIAHDVADEAPDNVFALFLLARASDGNRDFAAEAQALERIISICQPTGQQVGQYQILLAQSYARQGFAKPALEQYRQALASGEIGAEQAKLVKEAMKTIETKMPRETP